MDGAHLQLSGEDCSGERVCKERGRVEPGGWRKVERFVMR